MSVSWPELPVRDPWRAADVEELARVVRQAAGCPEGPLLLRRACEAAAVRVLPQRLEVGRRRHTAMLLPASDGFHALVDEALWEAAQTPRGRHRLRFVLAHELGHTFFYRPGRPPSRAQPADRHEERFCNRFAGELLVPRDAACEISLDPAGLYALAATFDVSRVVAAWAIARARPDVTLLWLQHAAHPHRGGQETMRVEWGASHRYIPRGESFKSPLAGLAPGEAGESVEDLRLAGREERVLVRAWRFASAMLAVVRPLPARARQPSPTQLPLF